MRISSSVAAETSKSTVEVTPATTQKVKAVDTQESNSPVNNSGNVPTDSYSKEDIVKAVDALNEVLDTNNSSSKFLYHEGLGRYYVTVVDRATEEVIKEIPSKKLLDAFYEMQKMVGMIVDEKI